MDCGLCGRAVCDCYMDLSPDRLISAQSVAYNALLVSKSQYIQTQGADSRAASDYYHSFTGSVKRPLLLGKHD